MTTMSLLGIVLSIAILIPAAGVLFQAACILSNREMPFPKAVLIGALTFFPCVIAGYYLTVYVGNYDKATDVKFGGYHVLGLVLSSLLSWIACSVVYTLVFQGNFLKGVHVSLFETLMRIMLGFLIGGGFLVVMATVQVVNDGDEQVRFLFLCGLIFLAFLAVVGAAFLVIWLIRQQQFR